MPRKVRVEANTDVYTYSYLYEAAVEALGHAKASELGRFYSCMTAELYSALCLEAFLNHLGAEKLPYWSSVERKLGPKEKLTIMCFEIRLTPDFTNRPFGSFPTLFQIRNSLVHGKTEHLESSDLQSLDEGEMPVLPEAKWRALISLDKATQFLADTEEMIYALHDKSGLRHNPLNTPQASRWGVNPVETEQT